MRIATWNLERSGVKHRRRVPLQQAHLQSLNADILVLTECHGDLALAGFPWSATSAAGEPPYKPQDRAVGVWSRWPIVGHKKTGDSRLTCCVEVETPEGPALVYGTVLPYHADGAPAAGRWERHRQALARQLAEWERLRQEHPHHLLVVAGDFNMALDGKGRYGDASSRARLLAALDALSMQCVTVHDWRLEVGRSNIDHVCITKALSLVGPARVWPGTLDGMKLSDHNGVLVDLSRTTTTRPRPTGLLIDTVGGTEETVR